MSLYSLSNNATTTLNGNINNSTTTVVVTSASGFPSSGSFIIIIDSELMLVTAGQGTTTWTVTRNIEGTTAASHTSGVTIGNVISAGYLTNNYVDMFSNQTVAGSKTFSTTPPGLVDTGGTQSVTGNKTIANYPKVTGATDMLVGSAPTLPGANMIMQAGSSVITLDVNGQANIVYPVAFPNGVVSAVLMNGDGGAHPNLVFETEAPACTLSACNFKARTGSTGVAGANFTLRVNWIAVGY